jgi:hypothetical protein
MMEKARPDTMMTSRVRWTGHTSQADTRSDDVDFNAIGAFGQTGSDIAHFATLNSNLIRRYSAGGVGDGPAG